MPRSVSIIGAGKVGRVLGRQFHLHGALRIQQVLNRTLTGSQAACTFIGAGQPLANWAELHAADIFLLSVPDDQIAACAQQLHALGILAPDTLLVHCSGALPAAAIALPQAKASLHPVRSFADPARVSDSFVGTICSLEGDELAVQTLTAALEQCQAQVIRLPSAGKTLYHAAAVFASNYLVTVLHAALTTYRAAGLSEEMARHLAAPLARETLDNVFRLGAPAALTGPIARGDHATVVRHQLALDQLDSGQAELYQALALATEKMKAAT